MKKIHLLYAVFALLATGFSSCEDLLTEEPNSKYDRDRYFDSEDKAEMAVMGIYSSLSDFNHYGWYEMASPASDDTYYTARTQSDNQVHDIAHYQLNSTNTWIESIWKLKYEGIDRANLTIDGICGMTGYAENTRLQGRRIKNYFPVKVVTNIFHPIPLLVFSDSCFLLLFSHSLVW